VTFLDVPAIVSQPKLTGSTHVVPGQRPSSGAAITSMTCCALRLVPGECEGAPPRGGRTGCNPFGLFDTHGNVWEWVQDVWEPSYFAEFANKPAIDPTVASSAGTAWRARGWWYDSELLTSPRCRYGGDPGRRDRDRRLSSHTPGRWCAKCLGTQRPVTGDPAWSKCVQPCSFMT